MNNGRDCEHGRQVGKCDICDLVEAEAENKRLRLALVSSQRDLLAQQIRAERELLDRLYRDWQASAFGGESLNFGRWLIERYALRAGR